MKNIVNRYFTNSLYFGIVLLFLASCGSTKEAASAAQKYKPLENSLLWKIEGNGLVSPSYLYGTIHMINADDYFLPNGTMSAIDAADQIVFEIDMNEMNDMGSMMGLMSKAFMNGGKALSDLLSKEDYDMVKKYFQTKGVPLMMLERIKPAFLTVFTYDMDPSGMQNGSVKSYEMEFFDLANDVGKPVSGLETLEFQMSVFDSIPYESQAMMLVDAIKSNDVGNDEFKKMTEMYKAQNINDMVKMIEEDETMGGNTEDILLVGRNKNWIPIMSTLMKTKKVFFAVGAGHLAGEMGVINLLREEGFTLTPMNKK